MIIIILEDNFINLSERIGLNLEQKLLRFIKYNKKEKQNKDDINYLKSVKEYIDLIKNNNINIENFNKEINNPKISFISPIFNKDKYLKSLIISLQKQLIEDYEIIFIDDCSKDNSFKIINDFSRIDQRIKLIKNKINKGTLYSRIQGALQSKGEYIIFIDSDDMILKDGLYNSYNYLKRSDLSMVQFNTIFNRNNILNLSKRYYKYEKIIKQPILSYIFYYNEKNRKADENNTALWDKLIKREIVIKACYFIGEEYYNENIKIENDVILLYSIFRTAHSYQYINEIGYYYVRTHNDSITNTWNKLKISNLIIHGLFVNIKFLYEKSENSYLGKSLCVFKLKQSYKRYFKCFKKIGLEYYFVKKVLQLMINCPYILLEDKNIISNINTKFSLFYSNKT